MKKIAKKGAGDEAGTAGFRRDGDVVLCGEAKVASVRADGGLKMARGCGRYRSGVVAFLEGVGKEGGELPGLRGSGPKRDVSGAGICGGEGGKLIEGCGVSPRVSEGHRPPLHPPGPLAPGAGGEGSYPEPPCPAEDPRAGDKTPEVVAWFFRYRPAEAKARYRGRRFEMPVL